MRIGIVGRTCLPILLAFGGCLVPVSPASGDETLVATFTVTTGEDVQAPPARYLDDSLGLCSPVLCTLRGAIAEANAKPGLDRIAFNIALGARRITLRDDLPAITDPVVIDGTTQPGYEAAGHPLIELHGAGTALIGVYLSDTADHSTVRGLALGGFRGRGIYSDSDSHGHLIEHNYVGLDHTGRSTNAITNNDLFGTGLSLFGDANIIKQNVVSGNDFGIFLYGDQNVFTGNLVGTDALGRQPLGNRRTAVSVHGRHNLIGGTAAIDRNVISATTGGSFDLGLGLVIGSSSNVVMGNFIGTDITGMHDLGNARSGVAIYGSDNVVGGSSAGAGNVISGNDRSGVAIVRTASFNNPANGNVVAGNLIGTDITGESPLGNSDDGVRIIGKAEGNVIGGDEPGTPNTIAYNREDGVTVVKDFVGFGTRNVIKRNSIFSNGQLGIDLGNNGPTANDVGDMDTGPNRLQNAPVLTSITGGARAVVVHGELQSAPHSIYTVDLFVNDECDSSSFGEGRYFAGRTNITTDDAGAARLNMKVREGFRNRYFSALVHDEEGNTSEFSNCVG